MKRPITLIILVVSMLMVAGFSYATNINILLQSYHIQNTNPDPITYPYYGSYYDIISDTPIEMVDPYVQTTADGGQLSNSSIFLKTYVHAGLFHANADAALIFQVTEGSFIDVSATSHSPEEELREFSQLTDITTGTILYSYYVNLGNYVGDLVTYRFPVLPTHTYEIEAYTFATEWYGGTTSVNIQAVPEPTTMLLLGLGLVGLAGIRRKLKK